MKEITDAQFDEEVLKSELPVMVDFWAPWCGPCKMLGPVVEEIAGGFEGQVKVVKVNIDENSVVASRYKIMSIPTLYFFKAGQIIDQIVGVVPRAEIEKKLKGLMK